MKWLFNSDFELTSFGRRLAKFCASLYALAIGMMCFLPQAWYPQDKTFSTPGIVQVGRLYFLPTPFNTLVNGNQLTSLQDLWLVVLQNLANIFLLFPLVFALICLFEKWRSWQAVLVRSFLMSMTIELTQIILDILIDAQRVFETDDLITNTLGGLLAYGLYFVLKKCKRETSKVRSLS